MTGVAYLAGMAGWEVLGDPGSVKQEWRALVPLIEFAQPVRLPGANAWSLNVVYSQPRTVQRYG